MSLGHKKVSIQLTDLVNKNQVTDQFNHISYFNINYCFSNFGELVCREDYLIFPQSVAFLFPAIGKKEVMRYFFLGVINDTQNVPFLSIHVSGTQNVTF